MKPSLPRLSLIWAMAENRVIGRDNQLPWRLPADLKWFRAITSGHHIIMGRKTYESLPKLLPERTHIIVTSERDYRAAEGCIVVHDIDEAIAAAQGDSEIFVVGGASLYGQTLARAECLFITLIHAQIEGDTRFPPFEWEDWDEISREAHAPDEKNVYPYTFLVLKRKRRAA